MRLSKSPAVSLEGDRIRCLLLNRCLTSSQAKTDYTHDPQGCQANHRPFPSRLVPAGTGAPAVDRRPLDLGALQDDPVDPALAELHRVSPGRRGLGQVGDLLPVDLDAALLDQPPGLGR